MNLQRRGATKGRKTLLLVGWTLFLGKKGVVWESWESACGFGLGHLQSQAIGHSVVSGEIWDSSRCFQLKQIEPGVFHFAPRRGVSFIPTPSPPKRWKGDFFFVLPPSPWNIPHRWIYKSPPAVQRVDRREAPKSFWPKPASCAPVRALGYFKFAYYRFVFCTCCFDHGFVLCVEDIMFSKHLRDQHKGATTSPTTRSSRRTPSSSDQRGKCVAVVLPGSSSKKLRSSSSAFPSSSSGRHTSPPPPPPLPRDLGAGHRSLSPPLRGGV
ncbi:UNVERIFIED_CONTAM: hypothetical protein Sradi_3342000 [Sesamum radiatum]|uniref:Uncharacterized protein n=1 Tax=Sesamum radiatum TaxID=300843 RepID=A0AAW2R2F4_SESRA